VRRVLRLKEALGLFDDPYRRGSTPEAPARLEARRALAREVAARAIVLLKNARDALPLTAGVRRLAVVGPLADAPEQMCGCWWAAGEAGPHVGVLAGLRAALPAAAIAHAQGVAIDGDATDGIAAALAACDGAEAVVLCLGEAARMSGEAACRADPVLPGRQRALAEAVLDRAGARGVPVVAVLFSGRPLVVPWLAERADALVAAWFLGTEAGHAVADVLCGRVAPSGKTPMSWPRSTGQIPLWFGQRPSGRPLNPADPYTSGYLDVANDPLFAFGHGLGYTRFEFANLRVAPAEAGAGERFEVQVDVRNVGDRAGVETVFVFTRDPVASVARPLLELKRFAQARPAPGETETLTFDLSVDELGFLGRDLEPVCEPGEIELLVGTSAVPSALLSMVVRIR
jgi:beta-glucosidase